MNKEVQLLVFHLDGRQYGLSLAKVERVVRSVDPTPVPQAPDFVLGVIDVGGEIRPLLNVRKRFGLAVRPVGADDHFILARTSRRPVALAVDGVNGVVNRPADSVVAAERINPRLDDQIIGVIQLDDGLTLVHDLDKFASPEEEQALDQALAGRADPHGI